MAWAEANWVFVRSDVAGTSTQYIDTTSIRHTGSIVRYWTKTSFVPNRDGFEQTLVLQESDCENGRLRILQMVGYKFDGTTISSNTLTDWMYVTPGAMGEAMHNAACQK